MRFFLEVCEGTHRIGVGDFKGYETLKSAKESAARFVDDALPNNRVRVMVEVTTAYLGGDGGEYFADEKDS